MLTFAITAVLAAAVGYLVSWLVSSRRTAELSGQIAVLSAENSRLNTAATAHGDLLGLLAPVRESLDGLQRSTAQASERRTEAETAERSELAILERYLPAAMSDADLEQIVDQEVAAAASSGLTGPKAMGGVVKAVRNRAGAGADGAKIANLVKSRLA